MSMIEKVARAIWNIRREYEDRCDMELEDLRRNHEVWAEARAAITAMREPTIDMLKVGQEATIDSHGNMRESCGSSLWQVEAAWRSAVDQALTQEGAK